VVAVLGDLALASLVTGFFAGLAYALEIVSRGGAISGFAVGVAIYLSLGPQGFVVLALFVVGGSALTRLGYRCKERRSTAQADGGRRGARNALANCTVALLCAVLSASIPSEAFATAFVASLGAAFADTAESEVGPLARGAPRLITTLRKVPPGTEGAVSMLGTLAGFATAGLTALIGLAFGLLSGPGAALVVVGAACLGTVADSFTGALAPRLGNELTNLLCTLVAAALALLLAWSPSL
jgi:uncharacterized protein (TIGR00297 family)